MPITLKFVPLLSVGDIELFGGDYTNWLDEDELLTGTPTVVEVTTSDLTITNKTVNASAIDIQGNEVAIGKAVIFLVSGMLSGISYRIRVTVSTDATPARTKVLDYTFHTV